MHLLMKLFNLRNRHFLLFDVLVLWMLPVLALLLRTESLEPYLLEPTFWWVVAGITVLKLGFFWAGGIYRRYWRYASIDDLARVMVVVGGAGVGIALLYWALQEEGILQGVPRSLPVIDTLLTFLWVGGTRFSVRLAERIQHRLQIGHLPGHARRVVVVGAGQAGVAIVEEMQRQSHLGLMPVAFLDDDPEKQGSRIRGVPVLGGLDDLERVVRAIRAHRVIIAMPTAPGDVVRDVLRRCRQSGMEVHALPGIYELLDGEVKLHQVRPIKIEDLLRREPVRTDLEGVHALLRGQVVLVTGAGGSIGGELCRQVLRAHPTRMVLLGHGENSIFGILHELKWLQQEYPDLQDVELCPVIADIRDARRIARVFRVYRPGFVFHAAAHKHVPLMEANPTEAVANNVLGTWNVLQAARDVDVSGFVLISTDKAVRPANVMGASKRMAEYLLLKAARDTGTPYVAVRFGNVLGSRGSVFPFFEEQIKRGGPLTVTHPEVRRYFMSIPEAVQLVLQAMVLGKGGEIFVLKMGKPIRILDMARQLIELHGLVPHKDIEIVFTGLRPGEKLFEELFIPGERYEETAHEHIFIAHNAGEFIPNNLEAYVRAFTRAVYMQDETRIYRLLAELVPEYGQTLEHVPAEDPEVRHVPD